MAAGPLFLLPGPPVPRKGERGARPGSGRPLSWAPHSGRGEGPCHFWLPGEAGPGAGQPGSEPAAAPHGRRRVGRPLEGGCGLLCPEGCAGLETALGGHPAAS